MSQLSLQRRCTNKLHKRILATVGALHDVWTATCGTGLDSLSIYRPSRNGKLGQSANFLLPSASAANEVEFTTSSWQHLCCGETA